VHLKSLTLKGFKSFASATTLRLEPGITAVVGPNGSGKSNVVDAMAWVLGEQGAKALRGGKMDDVIFAGTADRPPLGRAEVTLTIDNTDGALPIDYTEVSITRRMFRDGAGEYEINGRSCRLLDIQELLSDSGIGREMHVIVGQGQLDAVLSARPEDRRAFIEEAAGVLKHRKRKEKALRKLEAMQANLTRLTDLTGELRRQLGPLGRQAEVARRAAGVQADLRDARLRLLADDIAAIRADIERDAAAEHEAVEHRASVQRALAAAVARQDRAAAVLAASAPAVARAQDVHFALSALAERVRGTVTLAEERSRNLATPVEPAAPGRDPDELDAAAERAEREQETKDAAVETASEELAGTVTARTAAEAALAAAEKELLAAARAAADRREGLARLAGQVGTARSRLAAGQDELTRLGTAIAEAGQRAAAAEAEFAELRETIPELDSSEVGLDQIHEQAAAAVNAAEARLDELAEDQRRAVARQTALRARIDALALGLQRKDGAVALLSAGRTGESGTAGPEVSGVLGSVSEVIEVSAGAEAAIAAALGAAADGVAVRDVAAAAAAIVLLRERGAGRAGLVVGADPARSGAYRAPSREPGVTLPPAAAPALDLVTVPDRLRPAIELLLGATVVVDSLDDAAAVVGRHPGLVAATRAGDLLGSAWAAGGSGGGQSAIEIQAAVDEAEGELASVTRRLGETDAALAGARAELAARQASAESALAALYESDARLAAVAEQLGRLGEGARLAAAEADRLAERRQAAEAAHHRFRDEVAELEARLASAESVPLPDEADPVRRDELAAATAAARQAEVEARLALRTAEERARATSGTAEGLRRAARAERQARERARIAAQRRAAGAALAARVVQTGARVAARLADAVARAAGGRASAEAERAAAEQSASEARTAAAALQAEWDALTSSVHSTEVLRAQQTMRRDQLEQTAAADYGIGIDDLLAEFGPEVPVPPSAAEMGEYQAAKERGESVSAPLAVPYDRPTTERRAKRAERDLGLLGKVNPLALEEFAAMEERHAFLAGQLEDLRATRKDLLSVVKEVDERILELFSSAYQDVAREFGLVFATLFPGGEGELVLTDPGDMLTTGIEVTARPPGKKVKRLSLLSGGERSLVAVAMLVAIFRARPSPFYVLDEVEAALDEVNLMRLVGLLHELRDSSQLIVITHQKYTMEAADVLYGVSMRGDGISQVISQRIRTPDGAGPAARAPEFAGAPAAGSDPSGV
jgi:chromosome segregation protein